MSTTPFEGLDHAAADIRQAGPAMREFPHVFVSVEEHLYICLAANRADFLDAAGYSIPAALAQLGPEWTAALAQRHQYQHVSTRI